MPDDALSNKQQPCSLTYDFVGDREVVKICIATHSPEVKQAVEDASDDCGGYTIGGWKRHRSS